MPFCSICGKFVYSYDKVCPNCGYIFEYASRTPEKKQKVNEENEPIWKNKKENVNVDGVVYLLQSDKYFKIGKTTDFSRRKKQIKLQLPFEANEVHSIRNNNIDLLELHWHNRFKNKRKNGVWFKLSSSEVLEFTSIDEIKYR